MKAKNILIAVSLILIIFLVGCTAKQTTTKETSAKELIPTKEQIGATTELNCTSEVYNTTEFSPLAEYSFCSFKINDSEFYLEIKKFSNQNDLNGSYQYDSSHLFGGKGFLNHTTYGDQSKLHVNAGDDYGAEFDPKGVSFYHLWFTKDLFLFHVTSRGIESDRASIEKIGHVILSKFE